MESNYFIRLDKRGRWLGRNHISKRGSPFLPCSCGKGTCNCNIHLGGISCYRVGKDAFLSLYWYWKNIVGFDKEEDFKQMQLTIFQGNEICAGKYENEVIAECIKPMSEADGVLMYQKYKDLDKALLQQHGGIRDIE